MYSCIRRATRTGHNLLIDTVGTTTTTIPGSHLINSSDLTPTDLYMVCIHHGYRLGCGKMPKRDSSE